MELRNFLPTTEIWMISTGRSSCILYRKWKYYICCLRDDILQICRKRSLTRHIKYFNFRSKIQLNHPVIVTGNFSLSTRSWSLLGKLTLTPFQVRIEAGPYHPLHLLPGLSRQDEAFPADVSTPLRRQVRLWEDFSRWASPSTISQKS